MPTSAAVVSDTIHVSLNAEQSTESHDDSMSERVRLVDAGFPSLSLPRDIRQFRRQVLQRTPHKLYFYGSRLQITVVLAAIK
jgi:hypothetical protein